MRGIERRKILLKFLAALLLVGFVLVFFHHHDDGEHSDCPVCAFIFHGFSLGCVFPVSFLYFGLIFWEFLLSANDFFFSVDIHSFSQRGPPFLS